MFKRLLGVGALLATVVGVQTQAQALTQDSVGWTVVGTITPAPCALTLSGGGVADFGTMLTATVQAWPVQADPARYSGIDANVTRTLNLTVNCASPSRFALSFVDNRASTMSGPTGQGYSYGLGSYTPPGGSATNIGRYVVRYNELMVRTDSGTGSVRPVRTLMSDASPGPGSGWVEATGANATYLPNDMSIGFGMTSSAPSPTPLVAVSGPLEFAFEPLQSVVDTATSDINLDGAATITLISL